MIPRSFATKIWVIIIAWMFLLLLFFGGILAKSTHDFYYGYAAEENEELTNTAASLSTYLASLPDMQNALGHFDFLGNVLKYDIVATDPSGKVVLSTSRLRNWHGFTMPTQDMQQIKQGNNISFEGSVPYLSPHIIKVALPIWKSHKIIGAVFVFEPFTHLNAVSSSVNHSIGWGLTLSFLMALPGGIFLSKKLVSPVVEMDKAVRDIATGNYGRVITLDSTQELASLGQSVNTLSEGIKLYFDQISRERHQLANILSSIEDGVLTLSPAKQIVMSNRVALEQFAPSPTAEKLTLADLPSDLSTLLEHALAQSAPSNGEFAWNDQIFSVEISLLGTEAERGLVAVWHDVTKDRRLDKMRREFVANVSHELRTPLSYLQGYTEALLDNVVQDEQQRRRYLQTILNETLRLRRLVNDILDLSRIEYGGPLEFPHENVDVSEAIENISQQISPSAQQKQVTLRLE
ncbi:MAG: hypothetical protein M0Z55_00180, partial [Peptococcaceae bacterium]|nr:hypothetical protein [Peptococcaceae bacterium]